MKKEYVELLGGAIIFVVLFAAIGFIATTNAIPDIDYDTGEDIPPGGYKKQYTLSYDELIKAKAEPLDPDKKTKTVTIEVNLAKSPDFYKDLHNNYTIDKFTVEEISFEYKAWHDTFLWYTGGSEHYYLLEIGGNTFGSLTIQAIDTGGDFVSRTYDTAIVIHDYKTDLIVTAVVVKKGCWSASTEIKNINLRGYVFFAPVNPEDPQDQEEYQEQQNDFNSLPPQFQQHLWFPVSWFSDIIQSYLVIVQAVSGTLGVIIYIYLIKKFRKEEHARGKK